MKRTKQREQYILKALLKEEQSIPEVARKLGITSAAVLHQLQRWMNRRYNKQRKTMEEINGKA